ncbi:MAG: leucine-rich repeat protein, partial [Clostridia bacterium]|nr:leucine-rich repeat protein [Clostridia bacterium]
MGFPDGRAESATDWPRGAQKAEWIVYADTYAATTLAANDFGNYSINLPGTEVYNSAKTAATLTTKAFPSTFKGVMETYSKEPSTYADAITYRTSGGIPWSIDVATKTLTLTVTLPDAASTGAAHKGMNALYETPWYHLYNQYIENVVFDNSIGAKTVELPRQLLGYLSNVKELTIPGYVSSAGWALFHSAKYEKVTFEEGVLASTGDNWFIACTALSEVVLPETLTTIANRTFNGCTSLKSLYIPDAVSKINYGLQSDGTTVNSAQDAFTGCTNLVLKYHAKSTAATAIDTYLNATGLTGDNKPTAVSIPYVGYL